MRSSRKLRPKGTGGQKAFCGWRKCFRKLVVPSENESYTALGALRASPHSKRFIRVDSSSPQSQLMMRHALPPLHRERRCTLSAVPRSLFYQEPPFLKKANSARHQQRPAEDASEYPKSARVCLVLAFSRARDIKSYTL